MLYVVVYGHYTMRWLTLHVYWRQILTSTVDSRTLMVNHDKIHFFISHCYWESNEALNIRIGIFFDIKLSCWSRYTDTNAVLGSAIFWQKYFEIYCGGKCLFSIDQYYYYFENVWVN